MHQISILKVEDPSYLWGRVHQGTNSEMTEMYNRMSVQMNLFYNDVTRDLSKLKPTSVEKGQVCVVYWSEMKSWFRAVLESVIMDSESQKARCQLVDYGERLIVALDQIRVAAEDFLQLPFWVRRFHLARIKPTTLQVSFVERKAELIPTAYWDSSATLYMYNLLQASTWTEAVLLDSESDSYSTSIELYLTVGNIKICVNDDLVAKKFAYYTRESAESSSLDEVDRVPVMLSSSILTRPASTTSHKPTEETQPLAGRAWDWPTAPSQSQHNEMKTSDGDCKASITEEQLTLGSQSGCSSPPAATKSDSSDNTVSSLAADLTRNLSFCKSEKNGPAGLDCHQFEYPSNEDTSCYTNSGPAEAEKTCKSEMAQACSQLLEWLNPQDLNPDAKAGDDQVVSSDPRMSGILVHSAFPVIPCTSLDDAPITDCLRRVNKTNLLRRKQYSTLSPADCYSWPAVSRGCHTLIVSHSVKQPLSYLTPLLTYILLNSVHYFKTSSSGPVAVLLCPGWEKAQQVYDLLEEMKITQVLHPVVILVGVGKDEAKNVRIPKNCLLLVTTPFSFVRLLSCYCFMFLRLCHLVLDEADQLFALAPDQMSSILEHFQKVTANEEKASSPQQLVAVAKHWTSNMEGLLTKYMPNPSIIMSILEEAALYGNVQQVILMTLESSKISELLSILAFSPDVGQKTLIVANSPQDVEDVFKAVKNKSEFCLKVHEGLTHQFDFVIQQWRKNIGRGTHVILVTTNECLKCFGIRDATCVVHYGFPTSPKLFGSRLLCMSDNFRNFSERIATQDPSNSSPPVTRSVLLISEKNARHIVGILRYLGRTNALLRPELLSFSQGILVARENLKINKPLCSNVKSFGVCRDSSTCPDRHRFISLLDHSNLPASGVIEVVPLHFKTASIFCGRMIRKEDNAFEELASEMASYYNNHKPGAIDFTEGGLYAVQEEDFFHRVKILSVPDKGNNLFFRVLVRFIDVGKEEEVKSSQILQLPERLNSLPCQAVEIVVCRVKPVDEEINWHPKVTRAISQKIRGLQHRARAVLSLGNTVFVDPMVRVSQVPGMKTVINEYNVQSEILNTGMGVSNPEHLKLLRTLCQEEEASQTFGLEDNSVSLEVKIKAEEEALADIVRAVMERTLSDRQHVELCEKLSRESPVIYTPVPGPLAPETHPVPVPQLEALSDNQAANEQRYNHNSDLILNGWIRNGDGEGTRPTISPTASLSSFNNGDNDCKKQQITISMNGTDNTDSTKGFHPQVCWYQTSDSVIVTVKLMNPDCQSCVFHPDRVVYSGRVNTRSYKADLELHGNIVVDQCCWEMKSNEPVLKLVKQQKGNWQKLLRNKNIFVSYDMEHLEEDEDKTPNGLWFMENTGVDNWYRSSESGSESD